MRAQEYLEQLRIAVENLDEMQEKVERMRSRLTGGTQKVNGMPGGAMHDWATEAVKMIALEDELRRRITQWIAIEREGKKTISMIRNKKARSVIEMRYIRGYGWRKIARRLKITERWAYALHERGLKAVTAILDAGDHEKKE